MKALSVVYFRRPIKVISSCNVPVFNVFDSFTGKGGVTLSIVRNLDLVFPLAFWYGVGKKSVHCTVYTVHYSVVSLFFFFSQSTFGKKNRFIQS